MVNKWTVQELVDRGALGALKFKFLMLMAKLGYDTDKMWVLTDNAPEDAKYMADIFKQIDEAEEWQSNVQ